MWNRLSQCIASILVLVVAGCFVGCKSSTQTSHEELKPGLIVYLPESAKQLRGMSEHYGLAVRIIPDNSDAGPLMRAFLNASDDSKEYFAVVNTFSNRLVTGGIIDDSVDLEQRDKIFSKLKSIQDAGKTAETRLNPTESDSTKLVVFSDFQCPFCRQMDALLRQWRQKYKDQHLDIAMFHYPLPMHAMAMPAAEASECARVQGKFDEYADALFGKQEALSAHTFKDVASSLGLDMKAFDTCIATHQTQSKVLDDQRLGQFLGVAGTPSLYLNGEFLSGESMEQLESLIQSKLHKH